MHDFNMTLCSASHVTASLATLILASVVPESTTDLPSPRSIASEAIYL